MVPGENHEVLNMPYRSYFIASVLYKWRPALYYVGMLA